MTLLRVNPADDDLAIFRTALRGQHSRRSLLRRALAIGVATPALGSLLAACGGDDDDPVPTATPVAAADSTPTPAASAPTPTAEGEPEPEPGQQGGQIVIGMGEPDTLLSGASRSATAGNIYRFIANGLTKLPLPDMQVEPDLATSWEASEDGQTFTFALREGVLWQDGEPFSAADVKFTFELWAHPDWPGSLGPNTAIIAGAREYKDGEADEISGIAIDDELTVAFSLVSPSALFLANTASARMLPRHALEGVSPADVSGHPFARRPIYTGPFMVEEWRSGDGITYRAFDDHFAGRPNLDTIISRTIPDPATAIAELRSGGLHLAFVAPDQYERFVDDPTFQTRELAGVLGWFLQFDLTNPLFSDTRVRQAMSHAIDREAIIAAIFRGRAAPNYSLTSPLSWIHNPDVPRFSYDVERANALMDEAGWELGSDGVRTKDGERFEFEMNVTATTREWMVAIQPFLEEIGVHFTINQLEFGTWIEMLQVGRYEGSAGGWSNFIIDPRADLQAQFESPRPTDATGYDNDEVNALFEQARVALDRDEEKRLYDQIQEITEGEAVYVYLWRPQDLLVVNEQFVTPDVSVAGELYGRAPEWSARS